MQRSGEQARGDASPAPRSPRASACPGLMRIVRAADGGLCRLRLPGGALQVAQAHAIAAAAARFGNGVIETTNRGNLQLRGVRDGAHAALIEALLDAGLGPSTPGGDDARNVMFSPAAGRDRLALVDTRPLGAALLQGWQAQTALHALSPKFSLLIDGGEALCAVDHVQDLWWSASAERDREDDVLFAFGLAGAPARGAGALGLAPARYLVASSMALLHAFLSHAPTGASRMRDLSPALRARLVDTARAQVGALRLLPQQPRCRAPHARAAAQAVGIVPQRQAGLCLVGAQPPLGRFDSTALQRLADLAAEMSQPPAGDAPLAITPWHGVLLRDIPEARALATQARLRAAGLLTDGAAPLARMIACAGSSGCARALADTQSDARRLAGHLGEAACSAPRVHLSGCARSCAVAGAAPFTLLACEAGRYTLYRASEGPGFGQAIASRLTIEAAAARLAAQDTDA